ncbi:MAG: hypothetical protein LAP40_19215 [Acidobacteriia bacterium]|nr:hypothetical protein [Terriglobia bacterium]
MDATGRAAGGLLILALCAPASVADDIDRGMELARAGRLAEARAVFLHGESVAPRDKRYPLELAGLEYRLKNLAAAKRNLERALALDPADAYGNDFLGTVYYLQGNLEGALRYWNRVGKPRIDDVTVRPEPALNPVLLDSALAFSPGSVLTLDGFRTTEARLDSLDAFPAYRVELSARPDERFDASLHWLQAPAWMEAVSMLRGLAYQTVEPEFRDISGSGVNWSGMLRWDAQKRRAAISVAGPLHHNARWRYDWYAEARSETWNAGAGDFRLKRVATGAELEAIPNGRISWRTGIEVSSRGFLNLPVYPGGTALQYRVGMTNELLRIPERRFTLNSGSTWDVGRMISGSQDLFSHAQAWLAARWLPRASGEDYAMNGRISAGATFGSAPFDEWFMLGVERDNDLWLRGHAGTIDGKKGSAPIGRNYFLANLDFHKELYQRTLFTVEAGPFLDTGKTKDVFGRTALQGWLVDSGLTSSVRIAGVVRISVLYGRDLRGGGRVLYATVGK